MQTGSVANAYPLNSLAPRLLTTVQETEEPERARELDKARAGHPRGVEDVDKLREVLRRIHELERERDQLNEKLWKTKGRPSRLFTFVMLALGAIALVSSVVYSDTVIAFIGLGLTFRGVLLLQLRPSGYLKVDLLDSTALSPIMITDQLLAKLGYSGKGIYMRDKKQETVVFVPHRGFLIYTKTKIGQKHLVE